jgi:hypothetical protein
VDFEVHKERVEVPASANKVIIKHSPAQPIDSIVQKVIIEVFDGLKHHRRI